MIFRSFLTVVSLSITLFAFTQSGSPITNAQLPLPEQYELMVEESGRYQQYRVVERAWLDAFETHMTDSLSAMMAYQEELNSNISDQAKTIEERTEEISTLNGEIESLKGEKDSISLFGMSLSKAAYHTIVWGIIVGLGILAFVLIGRARLAVSTAKEARSKIEKLSSELDESRKQRLAIEQDLRRKLLDERNKREG
ncbi:MAG: hypothetical protein AAF741_04385 [Bacteroidota bacterium]